MFICDLELNEIIPNIIIKCDDIAELAVHSGVIAEVLIEYLEQNSTKLGHTDMFDSENITVIIYAINEEGIMIDVKTLMEMAFTKEDKVLITSFIEETRQSHNDHFDKMLMGI